MKYTNGNEPYLLLTSPIFRHDDLNKKLYNYLNPKALLVKTISDELRKRIIPNVIH